MLMDTLRYGRPLSSNARLVLHHYMSDRRSVEPLINVLRNDEYVQARTYAAHALGNIKDKRAIEPLMETSKDTNIDGLVRSAAISALENFEETRVTTTFLIESLKTEEWSVRRGAVAALRDKKDRRAAKRAVEPLIHALEDEAYDVRYLAAQALGEIGDNRAVGPLIKLLKDEDELVRSEDYG